jgi:MoxR-like ATPase
MEEVMNKDQHKLEKFSEAVFTIKNEIAKMVIGQTEMTDLVITTLLADGHALIEGPPGVAKTLIAKLTAAAIKTKYSRIQFTPDLMPSDVLGASVFNLKTSDFEFKKGPLFTNIVLIDEINRAPAKTQAALFEAMEERQITIDGHTYPLHNPFMVIATQNPIEHEGVYKLPEAQLDRFLMKISVQYPTPQEEETILNNFHTRKHSSELNHIKPVLNNEQIRSLQQIITEIHIEPQLIKYISQIIVHTRNSPDLALGASPRASIALLKTSKAFAALNGRSFVTPEDIQYLAAYVLCHRIILTPEKEMEGIDASHIIKNIVSKIEVPR